MAREIPLTKGFVAIVDDEDFERINALKWCATSDPYAVRSHPVNGVWIRLWMHRVVLDAPPGRLVDHISGDKLDNRRANLRLCTPAENARNTPGGWGRFGFKGVRREKCGLYAAHIQVAGRRYYTYHLTTAEEAARAYDEMRSEEHT
ncbi:MAG: HNH endonuclease, partial [Phycisphaerales bacterium]